MTEGQVEKMNDDLQDGAVAIIVAVFIAFVGVGLLAFATDIGSLWQSQRALVTDTDAAALAGAIELAEDWMENGGECGDRAAAEAEAVSVLALNDPENEVVDTAADCEPDPSSAVDFAGWVQMTARQPSPGFVSGRDDLSAGGTTTAEFLLGVSAFDDGLAICADLFPGTGQLVPQFTLNNGNLAIPYALHAVGTYEEELGSSCGIEDQWPTGGPGGPAPNTPGGWGWLSGTCEPELDGSGTWCNIRTGTNLINSFGSNLGKEVRFPIFDAWDGQTGTNANLKIVGYLAATVESACRIPGGGGTQPKDPQECNLPSRLSSTFNGQQSHFIVVSDPQPFLFADPDVRMFDEAEYSICDVQGDQEFCRSNG
jgi:hypothetical protein